MAFKAKDGSEHTNMMTVNKRNASLAAKGPSSAPPSSPDDSSQAPDDGSQQQVDPGPIEQNSDAMQLVDHLKSMGYTADDVAQAMNDDQSQAAPSGQQATSAAPMQIPGM